MTRDTDPCPCGRPLRLGDCCARWHVGALHLQAPDAESLMRSRYSAYVLLRGDYLRDTWHASTRPAEPPSFEPGLRWLGLEVRQVLTASPTEATVEFVARSKLGGRAHRLHETSRFLREAGRWFYVEGQLR
ncbi:MAG: hypothetical protein JNJ71_02075 [Rubrivivax sp.]|nr:hypothetical protein [Rubrivivax sp.]